MDWQVAPPTRVTSPTWGPPPPCKQALREKSCILNPDIMHVMSDPEGNS